MLKQRVITALILLGVLLPCLGANSPWPFAALTLVFVAAAMWEWARLNQRPAWALVGGFAVAACGAYAAWQTPLLQLGAPWAASPAWQGLALVWVLGGGSLLRWGSAHWLACWPAVRVGLGALMLLGAWVAMVCAKVIGINFLLSIFCLVWAADIGAYFSGRAWGQRKLAPSISPGKSWEGVLGGLVAVFALAALWLQLEQHVSLSSLSLYGRLEAQFGRLGLALALVWLTLVSVAGDLIESLIKRQAGVKDSSQLLPGHGGVLDRIDALLPVLPMSMALLGWHHA